MTNLKKRIYLCLILTLALSTGCWAQATAPLPEKTLAVSGLREAVTVRRDGRGIPYIEAKNEADLAFAQGYVTASDRLWQMDLYRRVARGETAEIFGRTVLEEDRRWRKFGFAKISEEAVNNSTPENRAALESYASGVNSYIATLDAKTLPVEFQILQYRPRNWTPADSLVISKIFDDALSNTWRFDLMKAGLMDLPAEKRARIFDPSSPLDVLLVGKDPENSRLQVPDSKLKTSNNKSESLNVESGIWDLEFETALAKIEGARKTSLERIGFYAEDLAASNNWVVSGKRTI
ncbi:MAG: penicillin acylase family protein, partial [Acidobacteriota bacterium]|nr:penicillin acylase family protein [Acidobacteriota bacterium]